MNGMILCVNYWIDFILCIRNIREFLLLYYFVVFFNCKLFVSDEYVFLVCLDIVNNNVM